MKPIKIHTNLSDPYWQMLKDGVEMSVSERYVSFFLMQKRLRAINGKSTSTERKILIKSKNGFGG